MAYKDAIWYHRFRISPSTVNQNKIVLDCQTIKRFELTTQVPILDYNYAVGVLHLTSTA